MLSKMRDMVTPGRTARRAKRRDRVLLYDAGGGGVNGLGTEGQEPLTFRCSRGGEFDQGGASTCPRALWSQNGFLESRSLGPRPLPVQL